MYLHRFDSLNQRMFLATYEKVILIYQLVGDIPAKKDMSKETKSSGETQLALSSVASVSVQSDWLCSGAAFETVDVDAPASSSTTVLHIAFRIRVVLPDSVLLACRRP